MNAGERSISVARNDYLGNEIRPACVPLSKAFRSAPWECPFLSHRSAHMARYGAEWRSSPRKAAIPAVSLENHRNLIGSPSSATPRRRMQQLLSDGLDPAIQCKRDPFGTGCYFQYGGRTTEVREEAESWLEEDRARAISGTRHRRDRQGGYIVGPSTFTPGRRRRPPGGPNQFVQAGTGSPARRGNNSSSNGSMMMGGAGNQSRGAQPFFSPMYKRRPGSNWTATQASSPRGNSRAAGGGGAASHVSRSFAGSEGGQSGGRGSPARTLPHSRMRNTALGASHVASPARRAGGQVSSASSPYGATTVRRQRGTVGTGRSNNQPGTPGSLCTSMLFFTARSLRPVLLLPRCVLWKRFSGGLMLAAVSASLFSHPFICLPPFRFVLLQNPASQ